MLCPSQDSTTKKSPKDTTSQANSKRNPLEILESLKSVPLRNQSQAKESDYIRILWCSTRLVWEAVVCAYIEIVRLCVFWVLFGVVG
ncbi:hypothetical protein BBW65_00605 [Helicobacter enhydrae]|uniref:Uncharacterized protein n=1 Tax=Helicobacter enhydrae TaxID=222136 RepID=A0A1B1U3Q9_9HELI|nr:hypothetical protein BBW65_00605 [Helicobacter enhydrae]